MKHFILFGIITLIFLSCSQEPLPGLFNSDDTVLRLEFILKDSSGALVPKAKVWHAYTQETFNQIVSNPNADAGISIDSSFSRINYSGEYLAEDKVFFFYIEGFVDRGNDEFDTLTNLQDKTSFQVPTDQEEDYVIYEIEVELDLD